MTHAEYERVFLCQQCGQTTIVGPCHEHIDAGAFRCAPCRTAADPRALDLADTIAKARKTWETAT